MNLTCHSRDRHARGRRIPVGRTVRPAMADETGAPTTPDNGTTQPAPSKPRETLQKAVEQAGKVDQTRNWKDQDALTTFASALTTAQAKLADQTTADADLTAAETALTAAQERLVKAGTVEQDARAQKLPELEPIRATMRNTIRMPSAN